MSKSVRLLFGLLLSALAPMVWAQAASSSQSAPSPSSAHATDPRIESLLTQLGKVHSIGAVALSPDGEQLAWVVDIKGDARIQLADVSGHHVRTMQTTPSNADCSSGGIAWAPDSAHLAFLSNCGNTKADDKQKNIFVADTRGHDAPQKLSYLKGYVRGLRWSPDGSRIAFLYVPGATRRPSATAAGDRKIGEIGVEGVQVQRVATVPAQGGDVQEITAPGTYAYEFSWAPDSQRIAYTAAKPPGDNNWWIARMFVQDAKTGATPKLVVDPNTVSGSLHGLQIALPRWSPDGSRIAFIGGLMSDQGSTGGDIYAVSSHGGALDNLTPGIHVTPSWVHWTGNDTMLVNQIRDGHVQLAKYAVSAHKATQQSVLFTTPAYIGDGSAMLALALSADNQQVAYIQSSYSAAPEVHAGALGTQAPPAVTSINAALKASWGKAESVEWNNDGYHIQGWLLYPANYDPHKRYPMIVNVHGGPSSAVIPSWPRVGFGPVPFSALGYFVFMPNPRASYGQGAKFVQAIRKDMGYGDLRDILAGVDAVEKKVPVDDHRLGLTGWSYGGFMSMFAPTQTNRFRAVVAGAGISDWKSYYGQNSIDQWMIPFFGASVYADPAVYAKSSSINFIKKAKAPTLIVVGERDEECPAPQSFEQWHALRAMGVPTTLVVYPDEGHHFYNPKHQRDVLQRALDWFTKYLPPTK